MRTAASSNASTWSCPTAAADPPVATYKALDDLKDKITADNQYRLRSVRSRDSDSKTPTCAAAGSGIQSSTVSTGVVRYRSPSAPTTAPPSGGTTSTTKPKSGGGGGGGSGGGGGGNNSGPSSSKRPNLSALGGLGPVAGAPRRSGLSSSEPDTGFGSTLNYGDDEMPGDEAAIGPGGSTITEAGSDEGNNDTLLYIAAGLLVTVLSMHVLWLKAQVDRMPLEPLAPE